VRPPRHDHVHPTFTEAELLARTEEFNRNAERHWQAIAAETAGRSHVLNKPVSTVRDTGAIFYRLGLVLSELRLGIGHTVLDFAAGSCWLASCLNRLRCRTIAIDVSATALELGRELFRLDPRHRLDLDPQFLPYDGHRIPLPDASVDRVACIDAFHHVPNQEEVLRELCRVLRPGGRVVFAEPGEGHSHTDQSAFEMERFGVLENDLHLDEVLAKARAVGFTDAYIKPYPEPEVIAFHPDEYFRFMRGADGVFPTHVLRDSLRQFFVFVLVKGEEVFDSRNPRVLRAEIALVDPSPLSGQAGALLRVEARVTNRGDSRWLHQVDSLGGYVMLGAHLHDANGQLLQRSIARAALPHDVAPGQTVVVPVELPLPTELGRYRVRFDMVDEWLAWFEQFGSPMPEYPLTIDQFPDSRGPHLLRARVERLDGAGPLRTRPGARVVVPLRITNVGDTIWLPTTEGAPGAVSVGGHLTQEGRPLEWDFFRCALPGPVTPGQAIEVSCAFAAPPAPGHYGIAVDLVAEGLCWFEHHGSSPCPLDIEVTDEMPDSAHPGLLRAEIGLVEERGALHAAPGARLSVPVRVVNTGNTLWLHQRRPEGGHVAVGGHLRDADRRLIELDLFRTLLPRPVAPGEAVEVACELALPDRKGRYFVELDLVDEGIAWFGAAGSPTLELEVQVS
jgi:SAM-dependent methyltransferase